MTRSLPMLTDSVGRESQGSVRRGGQVVLSLILVLSLAACERDASFDARRSNDTRAASEQSAPEVQIIDPARQRPLPPDAQRLPLARVLQIAQAAIPGEVIEVELDDDEDEDDDPEYEITILTPQGRKMEVKIDARTGDILEIEED